jgi:hypothetical protein
MTVDNNNNAILNNSNQLKLVSSPFIPSGSFRSGKRLFKK